MYSYYREPIHDDVDNRRLPTPRNQRYVNEYARPRVARYEDYNDELDREYLGGGNQYGQLPRRRDPRRTMRGFYASYIDETPWCNRMDEAIRDDEDNEEDKHEMKDPIKEFRDEMRSMFRELIDKIDAVSERREEELNEDSPSVDQADVSTIKARTPEELPEMQETSAGEMQETCVGFLDSGNEIPNSNPPLLFPMQVIAPKDHTIDKDELEDELEVKHEPEEPMIEHPLATSQQAPLEKCKDSGTLTITRDIDSYILQMGDARDNDPPTPISGRPLLLATKTKIDMDTRWLSLAFGGKRSDFYTYEDDDRPYTRKRPRHGTFGWKPGWRDTRAPLDEGYEHHNGVKKFDLERPWDPNL